MPRRRREAGRAHKTNHQRKTNKIHIVHSCPDSEVLFVVLEVWMAIKCRSVDPRLCLPVVFLSPYASPCLTVFLPPSTLTCCWIHLSWYLLQYSKQIHTIQYTLFGHTCLDIHNLFRVSDNSSKTRGHPYKLLVPSFSTDARKYFFSNRIIRNTWNSLPANTDFTNIVLLSGPLQFLADRTNGRAIGKVLRQSVVCLYRMYCGQTVRPKRPRAKVTIESL